LVVAYCRFNPFNSGPTFSVSVYIPKIMHHASHKKSGLQANSETETIINEGKMNGNDIFTGLPVVDDRQGISDQLRDTTICRLTFMRIAYYNATGTRVIVSNTKFITVPVLYWEMRS
jgi:hypothetical protein